MKTTILILSIGVGAVILLVVIRGAAGPACIWMDRYGSLEIEHRPVDQVCPCGYTDVAYELRRDHWTYSASGCPASSLIASSSDHQILESYGATVPNIGEPVGNLDNCHSLGTSYENIFQHYDGVLCCMTGWLNAIVSRWFG